MPFDFKLPDLGEGLTEGELVQWLVKEGDKVKEHDSICKVETAKAVVEVPSPRTGTVLKLYHREGDTIRVGEVLATIGEAGERPVSPAKPPAEAKKAYGVVGEIPDAEEKELFCKYCGAKFTDDFSYNKHLAKHVTPTEAAPEILAVPAVRRLARELNADLSKIRGTGSEGRITEEDVRRYAEHVGEKRPQEVQQTGAKIIKKYDMYGYVDHIPLKGVRKVIAKRMVESHLQNAAVSHFDEADVTELWSHREKHKVDAEKKGVHLTFMPFIIKALISALKEFPRFNSSLDEEHEEIMVKKYYNIGIAVATDDGLIVPVVKIAEQKSILDLAKEVQELADKAQKRELDLADLKGNTFTITNYGAIGGIWGTPIINMPDVAILGIGRIYDKPLVIDGEIRIRKVLPIALTFDHRVNDGADAARFVNAFKKYLEDIDLLLVE